MVTSQEARILARLAIFPPSLETSWDVPREICLPGLAEYLGVVRSALHEPLKQLLEKKYFLLTKMLPKVNVLDLNHTRKKPTESCLVHTHKDV